MIRAIIIDDEKNGREIISELLKLYVPSVLVVAEADSVKNGLAQIIRFKPDLVLLDVQMQDGTGFELLRELDKIDFKIIFVTAYQEHAIKAFQYSAIDYILKPVSPEHLMAAISKAESLLERENINLKVSALLSNVGGAEKEVKRIVLKTAERIYVVNVKDIMRCESDGSYTSFYLSDGKKILVSRLLKEFEEILNELPFFRVHQSHLVNLDYFDYFEKGQDSIIMKDKAAIPVATRKKDRLFKVIDKL